MKHITKKTNKSKSDLFMLLLFFSLFISSCNRDVKNLDDLKEISFEENPTLINGFRLGYQPDSIGLRFYHYKIDKSPRRLDSFCTRCKKWRHKKSLRWEDKHSYDYILSNENSNFLLPYIIDVTGAPKPEIIHTKNPNVYYVKNGNKYLREVNAGDNWNYIDDNGNSFLIEEKEPIIYFTQPEGDELINLWSNSLPKGVYGSCIITGDFGKDTIITEFDISFKSENNKPILRFIFDGEDTYLYRNGYIINFLDEDFEDKHGSECVESYIAALNQKEVHSVINYFEKKFGKKKYNTRAFSGNFNRSNNKSFYREYRWSVGIVNIMLVIDDYPPTNTIKSDIENPYNEFEKGYRVSANFKLNDKILKIIEKEN